ncbi:UNVERIFIED_CONTAM: hypothetical protein BEN50_10785 [Euhalothece sp. KZN 001]
MSSKRVSELSVLSSVNVDDVLYIIDVSDTTDSTQGTSKQVLISSLADLIVPADSDGLPEGTTNLYMTSSEKTKLAGIESGAELNPSDSEIKTAYESNSNTNAFTDSEKTKLAGIEDGAEVNPSITSGTFSLTDQSGGGLAINSVTGNYFKLENWCFVNIEVNYPVNSDTNNAQLGSLPFSAATTQIVGIFQTALGASPQINFALTVSSTSILLSDVNGSLTNSDLSDRRLRMTFVYEV